MGATNIPTASKGREGQEGEREEGVREEERE